MAAEGSKKKTINMGKVIKVVLVLAIIGYIIYFFIKYKKVIETGVGAVILALALPILIPLIAGALGVGAAVLAAVVGFIKKRILKAKENNEKKPGSDDPSDDIDGVIKSMEDIGSSNIEPGDTVTIKITAEGGITASYENTGSVENGYEAGENVAGEVGEGDNGVEMDPVEE